MNDQLGEWRGEFGDEYIGRNPVTEEFLRATERCWTQILAHMPAVDSILEVGANVGRNLRALARITSSTLFAVEPNERARRELLDFLSPARVIDADAGSLPFPDASMDLVFTSGVLIHIAEEHLDAAYAEIHRVSSGWIASLEYFAPSDTEVEYRGGRNRLWKRDYGSRWLDSFDDVEPAAEGFFSKRATLQDDLTWWLFRKT